MRLLAFNSGSASLFPFHFVVYGPKNMCEENYGMIKMKIGRNNQIYETNELSCFFVENRSTFYAEDMVIFPHLQKFK